MPEMSNDPQRAMLTLRVIWFAIILGQAIFFVVALALRGQAGAPNIPSLPYLALAFAAVAIPAGAFLRRFIIRKGIAEGKPLRGLATGTILFLASCEGPSFLGSVCILLTGNLVPAMWVPILATVLMLIVFPRLDQLVE